MKKSTFIFDTTVKKRRTVQYRQDSNNILIHQYYSAKPTPFRFRKDTMKKYLETVAHPICSSVCTSFLSAEEDFAIVLAMIWDIDVDFKGDKHLKLKAARFITNRAPTVEELFQEFPRYQEVWETVVIPLVEACKSSAVLVVSTGFKGWRIFVQDKRLFLRLPCQNGKFDASLVLPAIQKIIGVPEVEKIDGGIWANNGQIRPNLFHHPVTRMWPIAMNVATTPPALLYGSDSRHHSTLKRVRSIWEWIATQLVEGTEGTDIQQLRLVSHNNKRKRDTGVNASSEGLSDEEDAWVKECEAFLALRGHDVKGIVVKETGIFIGVGKNDTDRWCPNVGRCHTSNNQGFQVDTVSGTLVQFCFGDCKGSRIVKMQEKPTIAEMQTHMEKTNVADLPLDVMIVEAPDDTSSMEISMVSTPATTVPTLTETVNSPPSYESLKTSPWVKFWHEGIDQVTFGKVAAGILGEGPIICADCEKKKGKWFMFSQHRWIADRGTLAIRAWVHDTLHSKAHAFIKDIIAVREDSLKNHQRTKELDKWEENIKKMLDRTRSERGQTSLMENLSGRLYDATFYERRDTNPNLLAFDNGVWDLQQGLLRPGIRDDNITITCGYNFPNLTLEQLENDDTLNNLLQVLNRAMPEKEHWEYLLRFLASCFYLGNMEQHLNIWIGEGGNCKGVTSSLVDKMLGGYHSPLGEGFLAHRNHDPNRADPTMIALQGKRVAVIDEPAGKTMDVSTLLRITGNVKTPARIMWTSVIVDVVPNFKPILICNKIPSIPMEQTKKRALQRRIFVLDWQMKFFESKADDGFDRTDPTHLLGMQQDSLCKLIDVAAPLFANYLLVKWYPIYTLAGLQVPRSVRLRSASFIDDQNPLQQWFQDLDGLLVQTDCNDDKVYLLQLWRHFTTWWGSRGNIKQRARRKQVGDFLKKRFPGKVKIESTTRKEIITGFVMGE